MPAKRTKATGRAADVAPDDRNASLLAVATDVFLEAGFAGAKMEAIAKRAGASMVTVYSRYANKETLFEAVIERKAAENFDAFHEPDPDVPVRDALLRFSIDVLVVLARPDRRRLHRIVAEQSQAFPKLAKTFWRAGAGRGLALMTTYLRRQHALGTLSADPHFLAEAWLSLLIGGSALRSTLGLVPTVRTRREIDAWATAVVDLLLARNDPRGE